MIYNDFKEKILNISKSIFKDSNGEFDIRNIEHYTQSKKKPDSLVDLILDSEIIFKDFISHNTKDSIEILRDSLQDLMIDPSNVQKKNLFGKVFRGMYHNDDDRTRYTKWLELISKGSIEELKREILIQQTRDILFFGSECEEQGLIDINNDFDTLSQVINNDFLKLHRVKNQTINQLRKEWIQIEPEIIVLSCHGSEYGLHIKDENGKCNQYLNTNLASLIKKRGKNTECIILSACQSKSLGVDVASQGIHVVYTNKKVHIKEATKYKKKFFEYLNMYAQNKSEVYHKAHMYSVEFLELHNSPDSRSFEFASPEKTF